MGKISSLRRIQIKQRGRHPLRRNRPQAVKLLRVHKELGASKVKTLLGRYTSISYCTNQCKEASVDIKKATVEQLGRKIDKRADVFVLGWRNKDSGSMQFAYRGDELDALIVANNLLLYLYPHLDGSKKKKKEKK